MNCVLVVSNTPASGYGNRTTNKDWCHVEADFVYERNIEGFAEDAASSFNENTGYLSRSQFAQSGTQADPFQDEGSIAMLVGEDFGGCGELSRSSPNYPQWLRTG